MVAGPVNSIAHDSPWHPANTRRREPCEIQALSIIAVGLHELRSDGVDGYALYRRTGGPADHFDDLVSMPITDALPRIPANKNDRVKVNWVLFWRRVDGRSEVVSIVDLNTFSPRDNDCPVEVGMPKPIEQQIDATHAAHVASRPESEFDTFDKVYWTIKYDHDGGQGKTCVKAKTEEEAIKHAEIAANVRNFKPYDILRWEDDGTMTIKEDPEDGSYYIVPKEATPAQTPPDKRPKDSTGATLFIRNHVKKHDKVEGKELNDRLKLIFMGLEPEAYIRKNGVSAAYRVMDAHDAAANAAPTGGEPKADERKDPPSSPRNGQSAKPQGKTADIPQSSNPVPQSEAKMGNPDPIDIKDKIREKYNQPQRGKDYLTVAGRILLFRVDHPDWTIETDVIAVTDTTAVFKASIKNAEGRVIASGDGRATEAGTKNLGGRFLEKAETAAIGRALALAGYGTDDTLDDAESVRRPG